MVSTSTHITFISYIMRPTYENGMEMNKWQYQFSSETFQFIAYLSIYVQFYSSNKRLLIKLYKVNLLFDFYIEILL